MTPAQKAAMTRKAKANAAKHKLGMTFDSAPDLKPGDHVESLRNGVMTLCWERVSENTGGHASINPEETASYAGRNFRVDGR